MTFCAVYNWIDLKNMIDKFFSVAHDKFVKSSGQVWTRKREWSTIQRFLSVAWNDFQLFDADWIINVDKIYRSIQMTIKINEKKTCCRLPCKFIDTESRRTRVFTQFKFSFYTFGCVLFLSLSFSVFFLSMEMIRDFFFRVNYSIERNWPTAFGIHHIAKICEEEINKKEREITFWNVTERWSNCFIIFALLSVNFREIIIIECIRKRFVFISFSFSDYWKYIFRTYHFLAFAFIIMKRS